MCASEKEFSSASRRAALLTDLIMIGFFEGHDLYKVSDGQRLSYRASTLRQSGGDDLIASDSATVDKCDINTVVLAYNTRQHVAKV